MHRRSSISDLNIVALIFAVLVPPLGIILSLIAIAINYKRKIKNSWLSIASLIVSVLLTALIVWVFYGIASIFEVRPNMAEEESKPVISSLESLGGTKLCDNGDSGHGIDNTIPWYSTWYSLPYSQDLVERIKNHIATDGYLLHADTAMGQKDPLQLPRDTDGNPVTNDVEEDGINDIYYLAEHDDRQLVVRIYRDQMWLRCGVDYQQYEYGQQISVERGRAIVYIGLSLPAVN